MNAGEAARPEDELGGERGGDTPVRAKGRASGRTSRIAVPTGRASLLRGRWPLRFLLVVFLAGTFLVLWTTNSFLTERFTESTRNRAALRQALYSGQILSELQRTAVVPLLLARDPELISALNTNTFTDTSRRLISAQAEIGAASIQVLDVAGRVVAATDRTRLGRAQRTNEGFIMAQRTNGTIFSAVERADGLFDFAFSRGIYSDGKVAGVVMVGVDLMKFEQAWGSDADAVVIIDSTNRVILSTEPRWRGRPIDVAIAARTAPSTIQRALRATADWTSRQPDAYIRGVAVMRSELRIPFRGWRLVSFTTYDSVRDRVNSVLALEIMGFALFLALAFYVVSRRAQVETANFRRESAELRLLNARLQREIAEREKAQKDLAVAEQTLAQSSKLAALGEMSASVSHELNQPLAAMKTYLAGARLLLQRKRPEEAMSSFQRIDDLIERMGAITRQLKSYARKGGEAFEPIDLRSCVSGALSMMEPTLRTRAVRINRSVPRQPVMVMADRIRLEQMIINLLRNALDATKEVSDPQIDILLASGESAVLTVRDNGSGISDLDKLFEPFFTTKKPGEGVGLGLAISSGIVNDLGGRLTARNAPMNENGGGGAVFEVRLPILNQTAKAAG